MKIRFLLLALVGLVTSFSVPAFAQQKDTVDPQIIEQLAALGNKTDGRDSLQRRTLFPGNGHFGVLSLINDFWVPHTKEKIPENYHQESTRREPLPLLSDCA